MSRIITPGRQWDPETFRDARHAETMRLASRPAPRATTPQCRHDREAGAMHRTGRDAREFDTAYVQPDGLHVWTTPYGVVCDHCSYRTI